MKRLMLPLLGFGVLFTLAGCAESSSKTENVPQVVIENQGFTQHYKGKIVGYDFKSYHFKANAGQVVTLTLKTTGDAEAFLFDREGYIYGEPYVLPLSGDHEVRVAQPRNSARKGKSASYELEIKVE
ncbi:hypothetical protein [Avibacterium paragallinarum]|uniref:hypothetical protein n=1 Tax=Avibacterium paragallinarum TaxID=728 RepID=UPI000F61FEF3|nr:hypothetical protein [Avibacterium paragallinarum]AZI14574.1 hypothetical protein EIA51_08110 [Avibacterium paragallinarum]